MKCPKCGFEQSALAQECSQCGVIFAKAHPEAARRSRRLRRLLTPRARGSSVEGGGARALSVGLVLAVFLYAVPFTRFVLGYLVTLVHELGHAATAWLFGYPAIPAFDFLYGGGVSFHLDRKLPLMALIYALFAVAFYAVGGKTRFQQVVVGGAVVYSLLAFTPLHEVLQIFMGHGSELLFAGLFFHRALTGYACRLAIERPLYSMVAWFIEFSAFGLSYRLVTSPEHRHQYEEAKGGGHWMDFSRLAEDYLGTDLRVVAIGFFFLCFLPPLAAYLYVKNRDRVVGTLARLLGTRP